MTEGTRARVDDRCQVDEVNIILEGAQEVVRHSEGQPRLAHPARATERDQATGPKKLPNLGNFPPAADEAGERCRQVAPLVPVVAWAQF